MNDEVCVIEALPAGSGLKQMPTSGSKVGCWLSGFSLVLRFSRARQLRPEAGATCPPHSEPHRAPLCLAACRSFDGDSRRATAATASPPSKQCGRGRLPHTVVALRERPVQRLVCSMRPAGARAAQGCASFRAWAPRALCWRWTMTTSLDRDVSEKCSFMRACVFVAHSHEKNRNMPMQNR